MQSLIFLLLSLLSPFPRRSTLAERLAALPTAGLPTRAPVTIYWDEHQIPFIEAAHDTDLACALGAVHAHLRLSQIEMLRRIAQGRIAEMVGPRGVDLDHSLRVLDLCRAVPAIEAELPVDTRRFLEAFVAGLNHYVANVRELPFEFSVMGIGREPWTLADVLSIGRLIATDVNWMDWLSLLKLRGHKEWRQFWARLIESGSSSAPSFRERRRLDTMRRLLRAFGRWGSNSMVVARRKSASAAGLIASDPHVGLMLPSLWLIGGWKSPSYHTVGLMFPGLPVMALGRNDHIAWGGTNMHAASSDLFDIGAIAGEEITEREETIKVRWGRPRTVRVRETVLGPVLSDAPVLKGLSARGFSLRWVGHDPSDEFTALLAVSRARAWPEFRRAFASFAVSGMNMLYADIAGNIGQVLAVRLPAREGVRPNDLVLDPNDEKVLWSGFLGPEDLPHSYNPPENFLVSANNRPVETRIPLGYLFSPDDRIQRITELLARLDKVRLDDLREIQQDVFTRSAVELRDLLVEKMEALGIAAEAPAAQRRLFTWLAAWDGNYRRESRGALAFETLVYSLSKRLYGPVFTQAENATYASVGRIKNLLEKDIQEMDEERLARRLRRALAAASKRFRRYDDWGDMHRLGLFHPLGALPVIGRRYRFFGGPTGGSGDTVMKTAHGSTNRRHHVRYGAAARHISDLSDMDENYFALLGGQDGWLASSTFTDLIPKWLERTYVRVPLRMETVRRSFLHRTVLMPAGSGVDTRPAEADAAWPAFADKK